MPTIIQIISTTQFHTFTTPSDKIPIPTPSPLPSSLSTSTSTSTTTPPPPTSPSTRREVDITVTKGPAFITTTIHTSIVIIPVDGLSTLGSSVLPLPSASDSLSTPPSSSTTPASPSTPPSSTTPASPTTTTPLSPTHLTLIHPHSAWASWTPTQRNGIIAATTISFIALTIILIGVCYVQRKRRQLTLAYNDQGQGVDRGRSAGEGRQRAGTWSHEVGQVGGAGSAVRYDSFGVRDVGGKGKGKGRERFPGERGQAFEMSGAMRGEEGMRREDGNQGWHSAIGPQWERGRPSLGSHQVPAGRSTSHSGRVVDGSRLRR